MNSKLIIFDFRNPLTFYILIGLLLHLISVFFSIGFYSDDEHFQILEPVAYLLGLNHTLIDDPSSLYWEWKSTARIRPWLQPYLYFYFVSFLKFLGISSPFSWALIIRLLSSLLGFVSIIYLFSSFRKQFNISSNHFNFIIFFTFWFFPFLHSRTSSENLSLTLFIFAFCYLYKKLTDVKKSNYLGIFLFSLILGFSVVVRVNIIITLIPIFLWVLFFVFNLKKLIIIILGALSAIIIGLIIDSLIWGQITNTYYQFYFYNIKLGRLEGFGTDPWWYYIVSIFLELAPFFSLFFIIGLIIFAVKNPKNIFTWFVIFTLIIISIINHKETRYVFPIYIFAPFFIIYFFETYPKFRFVNLFKGIIIFSNLLFLFITLFTPANIKVSNYKYIYENYLNEKNIYFIGENPYLVNGMEPRFYTSFLPKILELKESNINKNVKKSIILTNDFTYYTNIKNINHCEKIHSTFPEKLINLNNNWQRLKYNWYFIGCK